MFATVVICNALVSITLFVGTGWAVFVAGHSPWWFLAALIVNLTVAQEARADFKKQAA